MSLTKDEQKRSIAFQDAVGEIVDMYLREGMKADTIQDVLRDEADATPARQKELLSASITGAVRE